MIRDRAVPASMLGMASTLVGEAVTRLLVSAGFGVHDIYQFDSIIVTVNRSSFLYGFLVNLIAGGSVAVLLYYWLTKINDTWIVYKAIGLSTFAWFIVELIATAFFEGKYIEIRPLSDYGVHFIGALVNGAALGLLFKWFLFKKAEKAEA